MVVASPQRRRERYMKISPIIVEMNEKEFAEFCNLRDRNEPKPIRKSDWDYEGKKYTDFKCPQCDSIVKATDGFCHVCGQRLDTETIALEGGE